MSNLALESLCVGHSYRKCCIESGSLHVRQLAVSVWPIRWAKSWRKVASVRSLVYAAAILRSSRKCFSCDSVLVTAGEFCRCRGGGSIIFMAKITVLDILAKIQKMFKIVGNLLKFQKLDFSKNLSFIGVPGPY